MTVLRYVQPKIKALSNGMFANWWPNSYVEVGDFGIVVNGQFEKRGSLSEYGANFSIEDDPSVRNEIDYKDKFDVKVSAGAGASVPGDNNAKVTVSSRGRGSFLYHLANIRTRRPASLRQFNEEVSRVLAGSEIDFPKDGVLITELQLAKKATIIVSDQDDGKLELKTDFKPAGGAFLSGASGHIEAGESYGNFFKWLAQDEMTALIKVVIPKIAPIGGPNGPGSGPGAGIVATTIEKLKDWMRERRIGAAHLRLTYRPDIGDGRTVIAFQGETAQFEMVLHDMTAEEMVATMEAVVEKEENVPFAMEIDEQEFGAKGDEQLQYRQASG